MGRAHEVRAKAMAATAAKKSKLYSIYAKEIYQAAKGNPDPVNNAELRMLNAELERSPVVHRPILHSTFCILHSTFHIQH